MLSSTFLKEPKEPFAAEPSVGPDGTEHCTLSDFGCHPPLGTIDTSDHLVLGCHPEVIGAKKVSRFDIKMSNSVVMKVCQSRNQVASELRKAYHKFEGLHSICRRNPARCVVSGK